MPWAGWGVHRTGFALPRRCAKALSRCIMSRSSPGVRRRTRFQSEPSQSTQSVSSHPRSVSPQCHRQPYGRDRRKRAIGHRGYPLIWPRQTDPAHKTINAGRPTHCPHRDLRRGFRSVHRGHPTSLHHSRQAPKYTPAHTRKRHCRPSMEGL